MVARTFPDPESAIEPETAGRFAASMAPEPESSAERRSVDPARLTSPEPLTSTSTSGAVPSKSRAPDPDKRSAMGRDSRTDSTPTRPEPDRYAPATCGILTETCGPG